MRKRLLLIIASSLYICIASFGVSFAENEVLDPHQPWPQYANIAPLPGAGIALNNSGDADGFGALQMNIPVAYTPSWGFMNISAYAGNYSNAHDEPFGNGTGTFGMGFGSGTRVYISGMQVSRHLDEAKALNAQILVIKESKNRPALSFGTQDILYKEPKGRSFYGVATKRLSLTGRTVFASLGYGGGRFLCKPFAGVSTPIGDKCNFATEWDGFQINTGVAYRPGGRYGRITLLGGYNGQAGWVAGVGSVITYGSQK